MFNFFSLGIHFMWKPIPNYPRKLFLHLSPVHLVHRFLVSLWLFIKIWVYLVILNSFSGNGGLALFVQNEQKSLHEPLVLVPNSKKWKILTLFLVRYPTNKGQMNPDNVLNVPLIPWVTAKTIKIFSYYDID